MWIAVVIASFWEQYPSSGTWLGCPLVRGTMLLMVFADGMFCTILYHGLIDGIDGRSDGTIGKKSILLISLSHNYVV